jgi:nucleolar protein 4
MDKITGISRGNGFVCFKSAEVAAKCAEDYEHARITAESARFSQEIVSSGKSALNPSLPESTNEATKDFFLDGRLLSVTLAVSKDIAEKISHASTLSRRATDKRHLYLMREGVIFPGSEASQDLTPAELETRSTQYANKKRLLATNPNLFISKTRLSIRGIPSKITDLQLRQKAKDAVKTFWTDVNEGKRDAMEPEVMEEELAEGLKAPGINRKIILKQAKIIKDNDRLDAVTKKPKSKGYGFIEFPSHADALACLRVMNNQKDTFLLENNPSAQDSTKGKRLVVEFAVENKLILNKRVTRNAASSNEKVDMKKPRKSSSVNDKEKNSKTSVSKKVDKNASKKPSELNKKDPIIGLPIKEQKKTTMKKDQKKLLSFDTTQSSKKRQEPSDAFDLLLSNYSKKIKLNQN